MSLKNKVIEYLKEEPLARERKNKDRAIVNLLLKHYQCLTPIRKEILIEVVRDYNAMDRYWRDTLANTPSLRGSDYEDKKK